MGEAKIEIQIGEVRFSGEGDKNWLTQQLDKILDKAESLVKLAPTKKQSVQPSAKTAHEAADFSGSSEIASQTLVTFLKSKNATSLQVDKFLATAVWTKAKENKTRLKTSDVGNSLSKANQTKINNLAHTLNQNVSKGFCEKDGKEFFVTQEGREHLGV